MTLNGEMQEKPGGLRDGLFKLWRKFRGAYSTTEMKTGQQWIDGKEIYRKVIDTGALPNATTKNVAHGIVGMTKILGIRGMASDGTTQHTLPRAEGALQAVDEGGVATYTITADCVELAVTATNIVLKTVTNLSAFTASHVVVEYVK